VVVVGFDIAFAAAIHCIGLVGFAAAVAAAAVVVAVEVAGSYPKIAAIAGLDHSFVFVVVVPLR